MQTLPIIKNRLIKLYCFAVSYKDYLPYYTLVIKTLTTGNRKILSLLHLLFPLNKLTARLFLILVSSLNVFTSLLRGPNTLLFMSGRFWLLILHHFMVFYEVILSLRFVMEWYPSINLTEGGIFEQIIFNLSEPYFKASEEILPKGLSAIFAWLLIEQIKSFISRFYRVLTTYCVDTKGRVVCLEIIDILVLAIFGEKILPI